MKELLLYIDPNFNERDPQTTALVSAMYASAQRRNVEVWHYVGNHVSKDTVRRLHLERLFYFSLTEAHVDAHSFVRYSPLKVWAMSMLKRMIDPVRAYVKRHRIRFPIAYPAALEQVDIIGDDRDLSPFASVMTQLCNRLTAGASDDWIVPMFIADCPPTHVPIVARVLRHKAGQSRLHRVHLCLSRIDQHHVMKKQPQDYPDVMETVSAHLELGDRAKLIRLYARSPEDAKWYSKYFHRPVRVLPVIQSDTSGRSRGPSIGEQILNILGVGMQPTGGPIGFPLRGRKVMTETLKDKRKAPDTDVSRFKDIHRGQRCFVVGNGPSLNKMDLSKLEGEYVFCTNAFFLMFPKLSWRPQYYTAVDTRVVPDRANDIIAMHEENPEMILFFPRELVSHKTSSVTPTETIIPPALNRVYFTQKYPQDDHLPYSAFSLQAEKYLIQPYTVTVTALQLAVLLGFDPIYLIGCDTEYRIPSTVTMEGEDTKFGKMFLTSTADDDVNHFTPDYFGKGRTWHNPQVENMIWHFKMAREAAAIYGRHIYNATVGGKLEVFPRINFDEVVR